MATAVSGETSCPQQNATPQSVTSPPLRPSTLCQSPPGKTSQSPGKPGICKADEGRQRPDASCGPRPGRGASWLLCTGTPITALPVPSVTWPKGATALCTTDSRHLPDPMVHARLCHPSERGFGPARPAASQGRRAHSTRTGNRATPAKAASGPRSAPEPAGLAAPRTGRSARRAPRPRPGRGRRRPRPSSTRRPWRWRTRRPRSGSSATPSAGERRARTVMASPQNGLSRWARWLAPGSGPKRRGLRLWSRISAW